MLDNVFLVDTRCYIAGVLMPVLHITIKNSMHEVPSASITLPADMRLLEVGRYDRVPVHIFQRETMVDAPNFILIFEGIISSRSYVNTAVERSISIECVGILDFLSDVKIKFMSELEDYAKRTIQGEKEGSLATSSGVQPFPTYFFMHGLGNQSTGNGCISYPSEYLKNMYNFLLYAVGDKDKSPVGTENSSMLAKFFGRYAKIIKLPYRYMPILHFDGMNNGNAEDTVCGKGVFPLLKAIQDENTTLVLLQKLVTDNGSNHTCRELLDLVCDQMEYEFLTVNNPSYLPADKAFKDPSVPTDILGEVDSGRLICSALKPILSESLPVNCNIIYRSQVSRITAETPFKGAATRVQVHDDTNHLYNMMAPDAETLAKIASTFVYPQDNIDEFIAQGDTNYSTSMLSYAKFMLETEEYTGPWIAEVEVPAWWKWTADATKDSNPASPTSIGIRNVFFHRQLVQAQYNDRMVTVDTSFNPYITVGFPGIVFDAADTSMSFCGYVIAVEHTISPTSVITMYSMNYARTLQEASYIKIVHPVKELCELYNDVERMSDVYQCLLGVPSADKDARPVGANAVTYKEILNKFLNEDVTNKESPQNNPKKAYELQRRNICTFDDYLKFQGLTVVNSGMGPEGSNTPLQIGNNEFIYDRAPVTIYTERTKTSTNKTITTKTKEGDAATTTAQSSEDSSQQSKLHNNVTEEVSTDTSDDDVYKRSEANLISVLLEISEEQFSKIIYK